MNGCTSPNNQLIFAIMNTNELQELQENCKRNATELSELFQIYDLCTLGDQMQEERIKEIYNSVLADNEFFASEDGKRIGIEKGGRVLSEDFLFLLSREDFNRFQELAAPVLVREKITDGEGVYLEPWTTKKIEARRVLIDFIINQIIPATLRPIFARNRLNYTMGEKLLEMTRKVA